VVAAGSQFSCAILYDGTVRCWGSNSSYKLGTGGPTTALATTVNLPLPAVDITLGNDFACALLQDSSQHHQIWCWGDDRKGQLGNGTVGGGTAPVQVLGLPDVGLVAAGAAHACASGLSDSYHIWCWGDNYNAQLGLGYASQNASPNDCVSVPMQVAAVTNVVHVAAAAQTTYVVVSNIVSFHSLTIEDWGDNSEGQLGTGTISPLQPPHTAIEMLARPVVVGRLAAGNGGMGACALSDAVYCWGDGTLNGTPPVTGGPGSSPAYVPSPTAINGLSALQVVGLSAGQYAACAVVANGLDRKVYCWGVNTNGVLGQPSSTGLTSTPLQVTGFPPGSGVSSVAVGVDHACAILTDLSVWCWGNDADGELGDGQILNSPTAVQAIGW
jgi:alpha-tubulin suppressor-like RCC1 family protein